MALESALASGELQLESLVENPTSAPAATQTPPPSEDNGCPGGAKTDQTVAAPAEVPTETFTPEEIAVNVTTEPAPPYGTINYDPDTFEEWLKGGSITSYERKTKIRELRDLGVPTADIHIAWQAGGDAAVDKMYDRFKEAVGGGGAGDSLEALWRERRLSDASPGRGRPGVIKPDEVYFEYGDSYLLHSTLREFYRRDLTAGQKKLYKDVTSREERLNSALQGGGRKDWRNVNADQ